MENKGNMYALAALKKKRSAMASEIVQLERQIRHRRESLVHIDATLTILDPSIDPDAIPNKRITKRVKLFRHGELGRLIMGAFREADGLALSAKDIVSHVIANGGFEESARKTMAQRVRGNLAYLQRQGKVEKIGAGATAKWKLTALA